MKLNLLLAFAYILVCPLLFAQNTDSDSYDNYLDLDDDNDGIRDRAESSDYVLSKFRWTLNFPAGNLTMDEVYNTKITDWAISSTSLLSFNSGIFSVVNNEIEISSTPSNTFAQALSNGDYIEMSFVTSNELSDITLRNVSSGWYIPSSGDSFYTATQFSETSTGIWTTLSSDVFHTDDGTSYANFDNMTVPNIKLKPNTSYTARFYVYGQVNDTAATFSNIDDFTFFIDASRVQDTDNDGIYDHLDLDSDNDGCPDALEGDAPYSQIGYTNLDSNSRILGSIDSNGVPTIAYSGQGIGSSIDTSQRSTECNSCFEENPDFVDTDGDSIGDACDLDIDNDGILNFTECPSIGLSNLNAIIGNETNLQVGDYLVDENAISLQGTTYDVVIEIIELYKPTGRLEVYTSGGFKNLRFRGVRATEDPYVLYDLSIVSSGSATASTPNGTAVTLNDVTLILPDLDSGSGQFSDMAGYQLSDAPDQIRMGDEIYPVEFVNGGGPSTQYQKLGTDFNNGSESSANSDYSISLIYNSFSSKRLLFGVTGTNTGNLNRIFFNRVKVACDPDNDTVSNEYDIDSDNDGIPDNVEAQPTIGYISPSGIGTTINDANNDGLDDAFGSGFSTLEDTDQDGISDYLDLDTDSDGIPDIEENGMANAIITFSDSDNDGLDLLFEGANASDPFDVNDEIDDPTDLSVLPDTDSDLTLGGDLDYRDDLDVFYPSATIDFDGVDDYINVPDLQMSGWREGTLSAWIKLDASFSHSGNVVGQNMFRIWVDSNRRIQGYVITNNSGTSYALSSTYQLPRNEWHHVTLSFIGATKSIKLYVDGAPVDQVTYLNSGSALSTTASNTNPNFAIGRYERFGNSYFHGSIDEVRVFNKNMTDEQIQQMVYQEIENNNGNVRGSIIPKDVEDLTSNIKIPWSNLEGYYPMTNIVNSTIEDYSNNNNTGHLKNITSIQPQTAPMPYESVSNGNWTEESTWLHGNVWDIEDVANNKNWSIIHIKDNVVASHSPTNLGLFIDSDKYLRINADNQENNTWYLELNGTLDLQNDSQLVQGIHSDLVTSAEGKILRRQEGLSNVYRYNYWASPVGAKQVTLLTDNNTAYNNDNNTAFKLNTLKDANGNIQFTSSHNPPATTPATISTRWLYTYNSGVSYYHWDKLLVTDDVSPGIGWSQKGTGVGASEFQYVFDGKPNNGTILIPATDIGGPGSVGGTSKTEFLTGNPYPSAINAHQFIDDNIGTIGGAIYLWEQWAGNTHILNEYEGGYATLNKLGKVRAYQFVGLDGANNGSQDGTKTPTQFIPVAQGFMVEIANDGDIEFNNAQRIFKKEANGESIFFRNAEASAENVNTTETSELQFKKLKLEFKTSQELTRELVLGFHNQTSDAFDYGYDARLTENMMPNDLLLPLASNKTVIQAYSDIESDKVVDLFFVADGAVSFSIKASDLDNLDNQEVYLKDNFTNTYFDLTTDQTYNFTSEAGEFPDRFDIVFETSDLLSNQEFNADINSVFFNTKNNTLYANITNSEVKNVSLTNMLGQVVIIYNDIDNDMLSNGLVLKKLSTGLYFVNIKTSKNQTLNKKIIIK
ncbi:LamG-like jellyroll fold domain-containing protein [Lacinutrix salivirga]